MDWTGVTIGQALRRSAEIWPDDDFVVGMGQRITYRDFDAQVDSMAKGLLGLGVGRGDHVACWLTNSPAWLLTWFACCRIGATVVSIHTRIHPGAVGRQGAGRHAGILEYRLSGHDPRNGTGF